MQERFIDRWPGSVIVCVASGPSLTEDDGRAVMDWRRRPGAAVKRVIAVNTSFQAVPGCDVLYAHDRAWWALSIEEARGLGAELWTMKEKAARDFGLHRVPGAPGDGLCQKPGRIHHGSNSGNQAIGLAYQFGARKIILLGYDIQHSGGRSHWHGDHPAPLRNGGAFAHWRQKFAILARDAAQVGLDIVNCSRMTSLTCFRRAVLADELASPPET